MNVFAASWSENVVDYSVVLLIEVHDQMETVRLYDGAHGENELHRYTRKAGKQSAGSSIAARWVKVCAPQSSRLRAATRL
jgi:hypothetical protein